MRFSLIYGACWSMITTDLAADAWADFVAQLHAGGLRSAHPRVLGESVGPEWTLCSDLLATFPEALDRYAATRGTDKRHVAASMLLKWINGSAIITAVSSWTIARRVPDISWDNLAVRFEGGLPVEIAMIRLSMAVRNDDALAGSAGITLMTEDDLLGRLAELVRSNADRSFGIARSAVRMGSRHLWGNVALYLRTPFRRGEYDPASDADLNALLARIPEVDGLVEDAIVDTVDGARRRVALRKTCCLLYKIPGGKICDPCCLLSRDERLDRVAGR